MDGTMLIQSLQCPWFPAMMGAAADPLVSDMEDVRCP